MKKIIGLLLTGALIFSMVGCGQQSKETDVKNTPKKVEVEQTVDAFGTVKVTDVKNINIDFPASISKVNVTEGQKVKNEDVLFNISTADYKTQINNKERELSNVRSELNKLRKDLADKRARLKNNDDPAIRKQLNDKKNAEYMYNKAKEELASKEALLKAGATSQYEVDEMKKSVDMKKKVIEDTVFAIDSIKYSKEKEFDQFKTSTESSIQQKTSQISSLEVEIKTMKEKMNRNYIKGETIISDVQNGIVFDIGYVQGDIIVQGKKLLSIADIDSMIVEANVAEEFIKDVKIGADVTITPQADKSKSYKGKVLSIADKAVQKNGETTIPVRISIDNKDSFLLPDFNVDVKIKFENKK